MSINYIPPDPTNLPCNHWKMGVFKFLNDHISKVTYESLQETVKFLKQKVKYEPKVGIICGSGLGSLAESLKNTINFPYENIPNFPISTVPGHAGKLVFGYLSDVPVVCMQGRFHHYEGYPLWKCCIPVRVMKLVGCTHLIVTNAAGGINRKFKPGDIMIMKDHINFLGFSGNNPLNGPNEERFGPRFPGMTTAYDRDLIKTAKQIACDVGMKDILHEGVYAVLGGPNFETVAELKMLKTCGVDAVGMSTVHEVITANHCGLTVFAFSLITNVCVMDYDEDIEEPTHEEVMKMAKERSDICKKFVTGIVSEIGKNNGCSASQR